MGRYLSEDEEKAYAQAQLRSARGISREVTWTDSYRTYTVHLPELFNYHEQLLVAKSLAKGMGRAVTFDGDTRVEPE